MRSVVVCLLLTGLFSYGGQVPASKPIPLAVDGDADVPLVVGQRYALSVKTESNGASLTYQGRIKEVDGDKIVLEKPTVIARQQRTTPVVGHIPVLKRLFTNVGIAREDSVVDVSLNRREILEIVFSSESELNVDDQTDVPPAQVGGGLKSAPPTELR